MKKRLTRVGALLLAGLMMMNSTYPVIYASEENQQNADAADEEDRENVDEEDADEKDENGDEEDFTEKDEDSAEETDGIEDSTDMENPEDKTTEVENEKVTESEEVAESEEATETEEQTQTEEAVAEELLWMNQEDKTAPQLVNYSIFETNGNDVTGLFGDVLKTDSNLKIEIKAEDIPENEEDYVSGLRCVTVYKDNRKVDTVSFDDTDSAECQISLEDNQEDKSTYRFELEDKAGNKAEAFEKTILIDHKKPDIKASLNGKDGWTSSQNNGWYSESINGEGTLKLNIEAKDLSGISKVNIYEWKQGEYVLLNHLENIQEHLNADDNYSCEMSLTGEQNTEIMIKAYDTCNHENINKSIRVKIDNTAPKREAVIQFVGTEEMMVKPQEAFGQKQTYVVSTVEGKVFDRNQVTLNISSEDRKGKEQCVSGIKTISFQLEDVDEQNVETVTDTFHYENQELGMNTDTRTLQNVLSVKAEEEHSYQIKNVQIMDYAGNRTALSETDILDDKVIYALDHKGPEIIFEENEYITNPANDFRYFNHEQTVKSIITDKNLDVEHKEDTVKFNNTGYSNADIENTDFTEKRAEYEINMSKDGQYRITASAKDILGNGEGNEYISPVYVVDTTAPKIKVTYAKDGSSVTPEGSDKSYFNGDVTATIEITDANINPESVSIQASGKDDQGNVTEFSPDHSEWSASGKEAGGDITYKNTVTFNKDGVYSLEVFCKDIVGWSAEEKGKGFTIDTKAPQVEIEFDYENPVNGMYYNRPRKATVTVNDFTFDESSADYDISHTLHTPDISGWSHHAGAGCSSSEHVKTCSFESTVLFNQDGEYELAFSCKDKAGNESGKEDGGHFIIDMTSPVITVTFDNNDVHNEKYYKAARTATISVEELSFDSSRIHITKGTDMTTKPLPAVSGWTGTGLNHQATVTFAEDGIYMLHVDGTDLAENEADVYDSTVFVIDTTSPTVTFGGVENYSANNGSVAPTVVYTDSNMDQNGDTVVLKGSNHGEVKMNLTVSNIANGKQIVYSDVAHIREMDDMYTLSVSVTDLAGNTTEDKLVFSVNRFGSVYVVDDATQRIVDEYYTGTAPQIAVTEINIDELTMKEVTVSRDGETVTLKQGRDYQINKQGDEMSWKSYTYILPADNFETDGNYTVAMYSVDRATNSSDNRVKGSDISFAVDTTAPSIVMDGIEQDGIYEENSRTVTVDVKDNMHLTEVTVYNNDSIVAYYDEQALTENDGILSFTLEEKDAAQNIQITANDYVKNQGIVTCSNVWISSEKTVIRDAEVAKEAVIKEQVKKTAVRWTVILGVIVLFGGAVTSGMICYKNKKKSDSQ